MHNKKILLLTYAFPPNKAAESFLCVKALAKTNYIVDVMTLNPDDFGLPTDNSLSSFIKKHFNKVTQVKYNNSFLKKIFNILRFVHFYPDRFQILNKNVISTINNLDINQYNAIISWSQWHSIHLAALKIKKKYPNIRWVLHMSDPWKDNPFLNKIPFYFQIQSRLEKKTFELADNINFTSEETVELIFEKYPLEYKLKSSIIPHSFDSDLFNKNDKNNKKIIIRYLGNFYGPRNPLIFCNALKKLQDKNNDLLKNFKFEFYGNWIGNNNWSPYQIGLNKNIIEFLKPETYVKSLELMSSADYLLIIDAPFEKSVFFPSKLVDYLGVGKPIIAITPPGTSKKILERVNAILINPIDKVNFEKNLFNALINIKENNIKFDNNYYKSKFSSKVVGKEFEQIIEENKTDYIPKVIHLVPADGYGGVEVAAKYAKEIKANKFLFDINYIYDEKITTSNYSTTFNPFIILSSAIKILYSKPDIIITSLWRAVLAGFIIKFFNKNISLILFIHSETNSHWLDSIITKIGIKICDEIWADSSVSMTKRLKNIKVSKSKKIISFLPRILSKYRDIKKELHPNFIYWGRIGEEKQINISIIIFNKILKFYPHATFKIIGPDGGSKKKLQALTEQLKITKSITWYNELNIEKIISLAKNSSFYIQASKFEGMAVSVAEAMQLGLFPIVTNVGEINKYCKDNENSIIIKDVNETVKRILKILKSKDEYNRICSNAFNIWNNKTDYKTSVRNTIETFIKRKQK